jgi:hypothetical protein
MAFFNGSVMFHLRRFSADRAVSWEWDLALGEGQNQVAYEDYKYIKQHVLTIGRQLPGAVPWCREVIRELVRKDVDDRFFGVFHIVAFISVQKTWHIPAGKSDTPWAVVFVDDVLVRLVKSGIVQGHGIIEQALRVCRVWVSDLVASRFNIVGSCWYQEIALSSGQLRRCMSLRKQLQLVL